MIKAKVTTVGNSTGMVLPKEVLNRLNVVKGDALFLIETDMGYEITSHDPDFERQMQHGEALMRKYRNALKELAK